MMQGFGRNALLASSALIFMIETPAMAQTKSFDVPAQAVQSAIGALGRQADIQIIAARRITAGKAANAVRGDMTAQEALAALLAGTGLTVWQTGPQTYTVIAAGNGQAGDKVSSSAAEVSVEASEIVVTAQKREERLQDVPVPVAVLRTEEMGMREQTRLEDYYSKVPGLSLTSTEPYGGSTIAIRGLVTGLYASPTVGVVVDDVQYGSPTSGGFGFLTVELDPSDLTRIEVLRGPQGTLYGASSLGGLLKYVTAAPSTAGFSGRAQVGIFGIENGDGLGKSARGAVNVPFGENAAIRVSGFGRLSPGYIDDPSHGIKGVNKAESYGGRISALFQIAPDATLTLGAVIQNDNADGNSVVSLKPGLGDLEQDNPPGTGGYRKKIRIFTGKIAAQLGETELTAVSAYSINKPFLRFIYNGLNLPQRVSSKRFTQEFRAQTPIGESIDWLYGAFFSTEKSHITQQGFFVDLMTAERLGPNVLEFDTRNAFREYAAFTNVRVELAESFSLGIGGRLNHNKQRYQQTAGGTAIPNAPNVGPTVRSKETSFTYVVAPEYHVTPDVMIYGRLASGYRPGGPNTQAGFAIPATYSADKTVNYEIGLKANTPSRRGYFEASLYSIDWKNIQIALQSPPPASVGYTDNGGSARSRGVEVSTELKPLPGMVLSAWSAYNEAELTENFPVISPVPARKGERLPFSPKWSGSVSATQTFDIAAGTTGSLGGSLNYVGKRSGGFKAFIGGPQPTYAKYVRVDLHAGFETGSWGLTLFANNVTDKRAIIAGDVAISPDFNFIQPRTLGLSIARTF